MKYEGIRFDLIAVMMNTIPERTPIDIVIEVNEFSDMRRHMSEKKWSDEELRDMQKQDAYSEYLKDRHEYLDYVINEHMELLTAPERLQHARNHIQGFNGPPIPDSLLWAGEPDYDRSPLSK